MAAFIRWTTSIASRIDAMVRQIENHDALVSAAIRDAKEARARARVQLERVADDGRRMRRRRADLAEAAQRWTERALRTAPTDESRALECVRRRKRAARDLAELDARAEEHARIEARLTSDIRSIDGRIEQLVHQRNVLRTRQSRAEALAAAHQDDGRRIAEIDDILERWEIKVATTETDVHCAVPEDDALELELSADEERETLRAELDELLRGRGEGPERDPEAS